MRTAKASDSREAAHAAEVLEIVPDHVVLAIGECPSRRRCPMMRTLTGALTPKSEG